MSEFRSFSGRASSAAVSTTWPPFDRGDLAGRDRLDRDETRPATPLGPPFLAFGEM